MNIFLKNIFVVVCLPFHTSGLVVHLENLSTLNTKSLVTFYWQRQIENNSDIYNPIQFAYSKDSNNRSLNYLLPRIKEDRDLSFFLYAQDVLYALDVYILPFHNVLSTFFVFTFN